MALSITPADVKSVCKTGLADSVIQMFIDSVNSKIGACLESAYDLNNANLLLTLYSCHYVEALKGGSTSQKRAANGASVTVEQYGTGEGLKSTPSGRMALSLDTEGCYSGLINDTFVFDTFGDPARGTGS